MKLFLSTVHCLLILPTPGRSLPQGLDVRRVLPTFAELDHLSMPTLAAIDIGSNALRLSLAAFENAKKFAVVGNFREAVRLGQDVFSKGVISDTTMDEALSALSRFKEEMERYSVSLSRAVATSALREALNKDMFVDRVSQACGIDIAVIGAEEEARLIHLADELAQAEAVSWRAPYFTSAPMRDLANTGRLEFVDMHLSHVAQMVREGFLGPIDVAIIEATEIKPDGRVYLTTGIGNAPTFLACAEKVIIELNAYHNPLLREFADILVLPPPPHRDIIPIHDPLDRIGRSYAEVDPSKVIGVVHTNEHDGGREFTRSRRDQPTDCSPRGGVHPPGDAVRAHPT